MGGVEVIAVQPADGRNREQHFCGVPQTWATIETHLEETIKC